MNRILASAGLIGALLACNPAPTKDQLDQTRGSRLDVYFNEPGTIRQNMWNPDVIPVMIDMIDNAKVSIDFSVMGFTFQPVIDAFIRAHDRGVRVRMVGDSGHLYNSGYVQLRDRRVPIVVGNDAHIMHNKFMIVDDRFVFGGTANWSNTDLRHNNNNFFVIDHPGVAADFSAEFEQLFDGVFGHNKRELLNGRSYMVGDTLTEVWFSPNEDALGRITELLDGTQESVHFTIFAFTKEQIADGFIRAIDKAKDRGEWSPGQDPLQPGYKGVTGVIDRSQLHSNGQYHEVFRLLGADADLRLDGNDNSAQPGDYQAGGGRLHSKTMLIDAFGENPVVISGSFNWSSAATVSNDEYMLVMHGRRVADEFLAAYKHLWDNGKRMGRDRIGERGVEAGDLVINEIQWFGVHDEDFDGNDQFIELYNRSDRLIELDMWQVANKNDFVFGFPPGTFILPNDTYLVLDHELSVYEDGAPQDGRTAYRNGDLVLNVYNDNRQSRLYLKDGEMELYLKDPDNNIMDRAGDGGPALAGGPRNQRVYSMERTSDYGPGELAGSWQDCQLSEGGENVNEGYRSFIIASPGEVNSDVSAD